MAKPIVNVMMATPTGCQHDPLTDLTGNIISPRIHYGDGNDGMKECLRCKKFWREKPS